MGDVVGMTVVGLDVVGLGVVGFVVVGESEGDGYGSKIRQKKCA